MRWTTSSFLQCDPPVACKISLNELRQNTRRDKMPTRQSNKALSMLYHSKSKSIANPSSSMGNNQLDSNQALSLALQFVMGSRSRGELPDYRIFGRSDSNVYARGSSDIFQPPLAIEDVPRSSCASGQFVSRGHASNNLGVDIDSITAMAKQTLQNKKDRTKCAGQETEACWRSWGRRR